MRALERQNLSKDRSETEGERTGHLVRLLPLPFARLRFCSERISIKEVCVLKASQAGGMLYVISVRMSEISYYESSCHHIISI
jgi:hypothetical protein